MVVAELLVRGGDIKVHHFSHCVILVQSLLNYKSVCRFIQRMSLNIKRFRGLSLKVNRAFDTFYLFFCGFELI